MKRRIAFACTLALLLSTCLPMAAGSRPLTPGERGTNAPPRSKNISALPPAPQLTEEAALTALARKITASLDFSGFVFPGQQFSVKLAVPTALGGSAARGGTRPGGVSPRPRPRPARAGVRSLDDVIPCQSWPGGCPAPISLGPNVQLSSFELHVKWDIFKIVNRNRGPVLVANQDFQSPSSQGLSRAFVMAPLRVEEYAAARQPDINPYQIVAAVTLTAVKSVLGLPPTTTQVTSAEVPLEILLQLAALEVPKVFVLFLDKKFGGAAALYLPRNTAFQGSSRQVQEQLFKGAGDLLNTYNSAASRLNFVTWFGSYIAGLEALRKVRSVPHVDVKERKDSEPDLNDDDFISRGVTIRLNDIEVEDESSSLLLLGPPGTQVRFFQDRSFRGGEFDLQTSNPRDHRPKPPTDYAPSILLANFDAATTSVPAGKVTVVKKFTVTTQRPFNLPPIINEVTPNDRLSSFKWGI